MHRKSHRQILRLLFLSFNLPWIVSLLFCRARTSLIAFRGCKIVMIKREILKKLVNWFPWNIYFSRGILQNLFQKNFVRREKSTDAFSQNIKSTKPGYDSLVHCYLTLDFCSKSEHTRAAIVIYWRFYPSRFLKNFPRRKYAKL